MAARHLAHDAKFMGFSTLEDPSYTAPGTCYKLMESTCRGQDWGTHARRCSIMPEGRGLAHERVGRVARADRDGYKRTYQFFYCEDNDAVGADRPESHECDNAHAQAPWLCLEQAPEWGDLSPVRARGTHCDCWPRLDHTGLSSKPHQHESISKRFPLEKDYPTDPREYGAAYRNAEFHGDEREYNLGSVPGEP